MECKEEVTVEECD